jgi:hypothetical protein
VKGSYMFGRRLGRATKLTSGTRGLYVWGLVTYEDVLGDSHYTRFCQQIYWTGDDGKIVRGLYVPGRNESTKQSVFLDDHHTRTQVTPDRVFVPF